MYVFVKVSQSEFYLYFVCAYLQNFVQLETAECAQHCVRERAWWDKEDSEIHDGVALLNVIASHQGLWCCWKN